MIVIGLFVIAVAGALAVVVGDTWLVKILDASALLAATLLLIHWWPSEIVTDQQGVHLRGILGLRRRLIPWKDVGAVQAGNEAGSRIAASMGLRTDTLEIRSRTRPLRIVHTPRHGDRERLLHEIRMHGVRAEAPPHS